MTLALPKNRDFIIYAAYALVALGIVLPMLRPGFILTLDMVFTPTLRLPADVTSSYLFHALLHVLNFVVPADIIQKMLLITILLGASIGMHRLVRVLAAGQISSYALFTAGIFFAINPYTYSRFMAGQYAVLLGYALLPWLVCQAVQFGRQPTRARAIGIGLLTALIGVVSIHTLGLVGVLGCTGLAVVLLTRHPKRFAYLKYGLIAVGVTVAASSYWLLPLLTGQGKTAATIQQFSTADSATFAAVGSNVIEKIAHIVYLQGFWAEGRQLYTSPSYVTPMWGVIGLGIIGLVITGLVILWRSCRRVAVFCIASGVIAVTLAAGFMQPLLGELGYREPHKFVGILALVYSVGLAYGVHGILGRLERKSEIAYAASAVVILILPLWYMRVMFWGFNGQLTPRHYPISWEQANTFLSKDTSTFSAALLPWHHYMSFDFAGRIIANPAPAYFDKPVIISADPELGGAASTKATAAQQTLNRIIVSKGSSDKLAQALADHNIKYVLLARELDYRTFAPLTNGDHFEPVFTSRELDIYKNDLWRQP